MNFPLFFHAGEVAEIRAIGIQGKNPGWEGFAKGTVSGYFDDPEAFEKAAAALDKAGARGVYYTVNPVNPALLARAKNRLKVAKSTTQDQDVVCIRWLPIDLDPKRPADISSTEEELQAALDLGKKVSAWLEDELGFAKGIRAESGNGVHLLYRLPDLPNDEETHRLLVAAIAAIKARFDNDQVDIDPVTINPARIWKCYGTTGRKGDDTETRPHRRSKLFSKQPVKLEDVPITPREILEKLAALGPVAPGQTGGARTGGADATAAKAGSAPPAPARFKKSTLGPLKVDAYLDAHGISYKVKEDGAATIYALDHCPFNPDHVNGQASIIVSPNSPVNFHCFHASCHGKMWKDARAAISGDKPIAAWCAGYDPDWKPPMNVGTGMMRALPATDDDEDPPLPAVPPPKRMDPMEMFDKRGKRPVFVPAFLVRYLRSLLQPLCHTAGTFYRYRHDKGVWQITLETYMAEIIAKVMKDRIQADMLSNTLKVAKAIANKEAEMWVYDPNLINVKNGMLNIYTRELLPHDPKYGSRVQLPVSYDPDAFSERWHEFLKEIFPEDDNYAKRGILQQFFGYCLLQDCRYQRALFMYGTGANGKTTVLDVLQAMIGEENTSSLSLADLTQRFKAQFLQGKLVNLATETNTRDPLSTELLKAIISGDSITAERKYGDQFQFKPFAKFISAMNEPPTIPDKSFGLSRRLLVLIFNRRFTPEEIKPRMADSLIEEIDGVFNWAVEGLKILLKNDGFVIPGQVVEDTSNFMETMNPLLIFVKELCEVHEGVSVSTTDLWEAYREWCADGHNRPLGRNKFLDQVTMTFTTVKKKAIQEGIGEDRTRINSFTGIGLTKQAREWVADRKARFRRRED